MRTGRSLTLSRQLLVTFGGCSAGSGGPACRGWVPLAGTVTLRHPPASKGAVARRNDFEVLGPKWCRCTPIGRARIRYAARDNGRLNRSVRRTPRRGAIQVSDVAGQSATTAARLGLSAGNTVGEAGYDDDVDHDLRDAIADLIESDLLDDDADEVLDAVLLWWRDGDGDLTDALGGRDSVARRRRGDLAVDAEDRAGRIRRARVRSPRPPGPQDCRRQPASRVVREWMIARLARPKSGKVRR